MLLSFSALIGHILIIFETFLIRCCTLDHRVNAVFPSIFHVPQVSGLVMVSRLTSRGVFACVTLLPAISPRVLMPRLPCSCSRAVPSLSDRAAHCSSSDSTSVVHAPPYLLHFGHQPPLHLLISRCRCDFVFVSAGTCVLLVFWARRSRIPGTLL